jgi:hypothetical protein
MLQRLREIARAIRRARFPEEPKRKYDLAGEAMARPFGETAGRGTVRRGANRFSEPDKD